MVERVFSFSTKMPRTRHRHQDTTTIRRLPMPTPSRLQGRLRRTTSGLQTATTLKPCGTAAIILDLQAIELQRMEEGKIEQLSDQHNSMLHQLATLKVGSINSISTAVKLHLIFVGRA